MQIPGVVFITVIISDPECGAGEFRVMERMGIQALSKGKLQPQLQAQLLVLKDSVHLPSSPPT